MIVTLALVLVACGEDEPAPTPPPARVETPEAPEPEPETTETPSPASQTTRVGQSVDREAAHTARLGADARQHSLRVRNALRQARETAQGGHHAQALSMFEDALALAPSDERLMCETGFVAFRAENLDRAAFLVAKALQRFGSPQQVSEPMRVPMAMCLYNAGRVAEAQEQTTKALGYYRASLNLRENRIVRERFAALGGDGNRPALEPAVASLEALMAQIREDACQEEGGDEDDAPCEVGIDRQVESDSEGFPEAALISVTTGFYGSESYVHLAVRTAEGWRDAGPALYVYNPGAFGISEEGEVGEMSFETLIEGDPLELRFDVTHDRTDVDMGIDEEEWTHTELTIVCARLEEGVRCARLVRVHEYNRDVSGMAPDDEDIEHEGLPIEERYVVDISFDPEAGTVTMRPTEGELPERARRWQGTHALTEVLRSPDFALEL